MIQIIQQLASNMNLGKIKALHDAKMSKTECGYSGATVKRVRAEFLDGSTKTFILKTAELKECHTMTLLTKQKQAVPMSFTDNTKWLAMEDLGLQKFPEKVDAEWLGKVACVLAKIHIVNMDKGSEMPWLPTADKEYWQSVTGALSLSHFEKEITENADFANDFGDYLPKLKTVAEQFVSDMTALCNEKHCMTLCHGDLQTPAGSHIYCVNGNPKIIDFGFCRYAPFYIDLVGWFDEDTYPIYYTELQKYDFSLCYDEFHKRVKTAVKYNGFIYMYPSLMAYKRGCRDKLMDCIDRILKSSKI